MPSPLILSPCIQVCRIAEDTDLCLGCGRTLTEIAAWSSLTDRERRAVLTLLPGRLTAGPAGAASQDAASVLRSP